MFIMKASKTFETIYYWYFIKSIQINVSSSSYLELNLNKLNQQHNANLMSSCCTANPGGAPDRTRTFTASKNRRVSRSVKSGSWLCGGLVGFKVMGALFLVHMWARTGQWGTEQLRYLKQEISSVTVWVSKVLTILLKKYWFTKTSRLRIGLGHS